jgi:glutaredoxin 3
MKLKTIALITSVFVFTLLTISLLTKANANDVMLMNRVETHIRENDVMVFSKSYCPYCRRAKDMLDKLKVKYTALELDQIPEGSQIQQLLNEKFSRIRTVPQIFFKGKFWGGSDKTLHGYNTGELQNQLRTLGIPFEDQKHEL